VVSGNASPGQRATTRNGALWKKDCNSSVFGLPPPTARQIENWQPVVYFPGNNAVFGLWPPLWRAGVARPAAIHFAKLGEIPAYRPCERAFLRYNEHRYILADQDMASVPSGVREPMTRMPAIARGHGRIGRSRGIPHALRVHAQSVPPKLECHPFVCERMIATRAGAQTERRLGAPATRCRGSAGRWGACLAVRTPSGHFS
jgi:hypothetical protein